MSASQISQIDIKSAFVHDVVLGKKCIQDPAWIWFSNGGNTSYKLEKILFGLKLSPCACLERFNEAMIYLGHGQRQANYSLFIKHSQGGKLTLLLVYLKMWLFQVMMLKAYFVEVSITI